MMRRLLYLLMFYFFSLPVLQAGNGKKVYADYHGVRYTRLHDGRIGRWGMFAEMPKTATETKLICFNADNIDDMGRHEIAAKHYPLVGMQSNLDEDYLEYQILTAKIAGIDGFFVEWGFYPHENDVLLKAMQKVAKKYNFEVGVNWCDGWLYYNWITKIYPAIKTRDDKTTYMETCFRYLADSVLSVSTAPMVNGHPVFYHFGAGATPDEFKKVLKENRNYVETAKPVILRRWAEWGKLQDDKYMPITDSPEIEAWKQLGEIPTPWLPARVRNRDKEHPNCDFWASQDDVLRFLQPFRDSIWLSNNPTYVVKSGFVMPGMDNHGCGGWGHSKFYEMDRNQGKLYDAMWLYNMQYRDSLDMIFIASWSDYTEGHEIEPTCENGYRELETTLRYASLFKEFVPETSALPLPYQLFLLRKSLGLVESVNCSAQQEIRKELDAIAVLLSNANYEQARCKIQEASTLIEHLTEGIRKDEFLLDGSKIQVKGEETKPCLWDAKEGISITLPLQSCIKLNTCYNRGVLDFWYLDKGKETLFVRSVTQKEPKTLFSMVGKIATSNTNVWQHARIELYGENIAYQFGKPTFFFKGNVEVRDISFKFNCFSKLLE